MTATFVPFAFEKIETTRLFALKWSRDAKLEEILDTAHVTKVACLEP